MNYFTCLFHSGFHEKAQKCVTSNSWTSLSSSNLTNYIAAMNSSDFFRDQNRIFNLDETNIHLCINRKSAKHSWNQECFRDCPNNKSTLTFVGTFNANGSIVAPAIIYPDLRKPSVIAEQIPEEFYIGHSECGCMKSAHFYEYIGNPFITWLNEHIIPKPAILFIYGHSSHLTFQVSTRCENN